jgi:hypothetical protein
VRVLQALVEKKNILQTLHVSRAKEEEIGDFLNSDVSLSFIRELSLSDVGMHDRDAISVVKKLSGQLTSLTLRGSTSASFSQQVFEAIALHHAKLQHLSCFVLRFTEPIDASKFVNLTHLDLECSFSSAKNEQVLAIIFNTCIKLKHLKLASDFVTKKAFEQVRNIPVKAKHLAFLCIETQKKLDGDVLKLCQEKFSTSLEYLAIGSTVGFTADNILRFIEVMSAAKLTCLEMSKSEHFERSDNFVLTLLTFLNDMRSKQPGKVFHLKCDGLKLSKKTFVEQNFTVKTITENKKSYFILKTQNLELVFKDDGNGDWLD